MENNKHPSSFRDPSGYIFVKDNKVYRHINQSYLKTFSALTETGLYKKLTENKWLIPHKVVEKKSDSITIQPKQLDFITYPYEWSFSQIKDAALLTLSIHKTALQYGMVLKDATAYNVQFHKGKAIFIDTLSFAPYKKNTPWEAYGQFCRHFLSTLLLIIHISPELNKLFLSYLDGVPLDLTSKLLPTKTHFSPFIKSNIHMHAKAFNKFKDTFDTDKKISISLRTQSNIIQNMVNYISGLTFQQKTEWSDYYGITNYDNKGFTCKKQTIKDWVLRFDFKTVWDIGGNNGYFSRQIQSSCDIIISSDIDPVAVDENYRIMKKNGEHKIIPLLFDYTNPSPGIGFANTERTPFTQRVQALKIDCILALALVHHLAISANCTFEMLAGSFSQASRWLVIEFISPDDSWAIKLLQSKRDAKDLFTFYNQQDFESVFGRWYNFIEIFPIPNSARTLYLMKRK